MNIDYENFKTTIKKQPPGGKPRGEIFLEEIT